MAQLEKQFQGRGTWMDHWKVIFSCESFVRGLSAVVRGCPRLSGIYWCLSAAVRGMGCFLDILLSADVRGWVVNIANRINTEALLSAVVRGHRGVQPLVEKQLSADVTGFYWVSTFFWCVNRLQHVHFLRGLV